MKAKEKERIVDVSLVCLRLLHCNPHLLPAPATSFNERVTLRMALASAEIIFLPDPAIGSADNSSLAGRMQCRDSLKLPILRSSNAHLPFFRFFHCPSLFFFLFSSTLSVFSLSTPFVFLFLCVLATMRIPLYLGPNSVSVFVHIGTDIRCQRAATAHCH